jgi:hypothetical protein
MRRSLILLLISFSLSTFAQSREDHLEPTEAYFSMYRHQYEYYPFVYKHLIKDLSWDPVARILTMPSFSGENVLSIENANKEDTKFKVIYKICKESIWYKKNKDSIEVISFENDIDSTTVILIKKIFGKVLADTRYNKQARAGLDGVNYIFTGFFLGLGVRSGEVWSPANGTKMHDLIELGELLRELAKSENSDNRIKLESEIKTKGERLLKRMN